MIKFAITGGGKTWARTSRRDLAEKQLTKLQRWASDPESIIAQRTNGGADLKIEEVSR